MNTDNKPVCVLAMKNPDELAAGLAQKGLLAITAATGEEALERVREVAPVLLVCGQNLPDMTGLELAGRLVWVNALVGCAVVSDLSDEDFHEASEGLGLLAKLPPNPGQNEAQVLFDALVAVGALTA